MTPELKTPFSPRKNMGVVLVIIAIAFFIGLPLLKNNFLLSIVMEMFLLAYLGQTWNIFSGSTGLLSFGHAAFFGIGAYTSTILLLKFNLSPWIGMLVGGLLSACVGMAIAYLSLRYKVRGVFFALGALACSEFIRLLTLAWIPLTNGAQGIMIPWKGENLLMFAFGVRKKYLSYYVILIMLALCSYIAYKIKKSRLGYYLAAINGNEDAAEMLGIHTLKYQVMTMGISTFLAAWAGTFYAQYYQHFEPDVIFGAMRNFNIIFPVVLGGSGTVLGPIVGAVILQGFEGIVRNIIPSNWYGVPRIFYGLILVILMMYMPGGIVNFVKRKLRHSSPEKKTSAGGK